MTTTITIRITRIRTETRRTQTIIDGNFPKLVLQHTNFPIVLFLENVIYKGCLSGSQETSNHRDWGQVTLVIVIVVVVVVVTVVGHDAERDGWMD